MGTIQTLLEQTKALSPEQYQMFLRALGIHQEADKDLIQPDMQIDGYEEWESLLTPKQYMLAVMYIQHGCSQTSAAKASGVSTVYANHLITKNAHVKQFIAQHIERMAMSSAEMLFHLARMVRLEKADAFNPETGEFDMKRAIQTGAIERIKSIRIDERGDKKSFQVTFEERNRYLDILTKTAGLQKNLNIHANIRDMALEAGMSPDEAEAHEQMIEEKARMLADLIKHGESIDTIVLEDEA